MKIKGALLYNLVGTIFDKGLPLIISAFLTKVITAEDFGRWSLFYQFLIIASAVSFSPMLGIFSRNFHNQKNRLSLNLYSFPLFLLLLFICVVVYYGIYSEWSYFSILELVTLFGFLAYSYMTTSFRFTGFDKRYMYVSLVRLLIFCVVLGGAYLSYGSISYKHLVLGMAINHLPSLIYVLRKVNIIWRGNGAEFLSLSSYGFSSSMVGGADKFIILNMGGSLEFLGLYSFFYSLSNAPNIIIEALKKTIQPAMYKELGQRRMLSSSLRKKLVWVGISIVAVQFVLPVVGFYLLKELDVINPDFLDTEHPISIILIFSVGLSCLGLYHFVNPIFIANRKSFILVVIQLFALFLYVISISYLFEGIGDYKYFVGKSGLFVLVLGISVLVSRLIFKRNHK